MAKTIEFELLEGPDSEEVKSIRLFGADIYPSNIDAARMMMMMRRRRRRRMKNRKLIDFFVEERIRNPRNNIAVHGRERGLGHQEPGDVLDPPHGRWKIQKELFLTDVSAHWGRLQLPKAGVEEHILPLMDEEMAWRSENPGTVLLDVRVVDVDLGLAYDSMKLTRYSSTNGYVLNGAWNKICKDRGLQCKDKVGLYWDPDNQELRFSVLERGQAAIRI